MRFKSSQERGEYIKSEKWFSEKYKGRFFNYVVGKKEEPLSKIIKSLGTEIEGEDLSKEDLRKAIKNVLSQIKKENVDKDLLGYLDRKVRIKRFNDIEREVQSLF
jgi:hypothetical protein